METLDHVLEMWKKDAIIDRTEPGRELLNIPILHGKYLNILSKYRQLSREADFQIHKIKKIKWEYYTGKLDENDLKKYGWEPFPYIIKSELSTYMESDNDIQKYISRKQAIDEIVEVCISILKELNSRTYQIRGFIEYEKFIQGN
jgi:hypothetical protein